MEHLGYNVEFVMNITDIDDKIILRARQQHLFKGFRRQHPDHTAEQVSRTVAAAYSEYARKNLPRLPSGLDRSLYESLKVEAYGDILGGGTLSGEGTPGDAETKIKMHLNTMDSASKAMRAAQQDPASISSDEFFRGAYDILLPYLDAHDGASVPADDYSIFKALTQHWELQFEKDLKLLNCLPATRLTRVSEYMAEIVDFVAKILSKGFAYRTSDGSVYFDSAAFEGAGNQYARLEPGNRNNQQLQADGEGSLSKKNTEKKSDSDFALWKASKPGEPSWESPWGGGRPGWHIECSAMASSVLGSRIDIHSGGIDLAFPHHDNELAQSEAYWGPGPKEPGGHRDQHQWISYFLHMGHLSIKGSKMSKSLKNFTTITDALKPDGGWTSRSLRVVFLLGGWRDPVEITSEVVTAAKSWEGTVDKFFTNVNAYVAADEEAKKAGQIVPQVFGEPERELRAELDAAVLKFDRALHDSFNTPLAMRVIDEVISTTNVYTSKQRSTASLPSVKEVARWISGVVEMLGLDASKAAPDGGNKIGWSRSGSAQDPGSDGSASRGNSTEFHRDVSKARDSLRSIATNAPAEIKRELLDISDHLRDHVFVNEGIYLDDRDAGQPALLKYIPREELIAARQQRQAEFLAQKEKKEAARLEKEKQERERLEQGKLSPTDMFRTDEFSAWDEDGLPTKDAKGEDVAKSRSKKLRKDWERQKKKHELWLRSGGKG